MRASEASAAWARSEPEVLLWQSRIRVVLAVALGAVAAALMGAGVLLGSASRLLSWLAAYVVYVLVVRSHVVRTRRVSPAVAALVIAGDLAAVFVTVGVATPPEYYEQILLLAFVVLHFTEFAFGATAAAWSVVGTSVGFLLLVHAAIRRGAPLIWVEELWSVGVFVLASAAFLYQYGDLKRRLRRLVGLFERVESGDFSGEYDVAADRRPDGITAVGHAYNRVRAQLTSLVLEDQLSGCYNRRGFEQLMTAELARAARTGHEVALLAVDVDFFKRINDTHGHLAGDRVIRETGQLLRANARTNDVVARVGGEEFMILAPETSEAGALQLADRVVQTFRRHRFDPPLEDLAITVSVGVISDRVTGPAQAEDLRARADEALYAAKRAGRDRVIVWEPARA
ncbi:MAG: diguanylate cyclase [Gemmatimonadaceae bacterium]